MAHQGVDFGGVVDEGVAVADGSSREPLAMGLPGI